MKKKELLKTKPILATQKMFEVFRSDIAEKIEHSNYSGGKWYTYNYKYKRYFRVAIYEDILKAAVFTRKQLEKKMATPMYEVYCDRKNREFATYEVLTGKWFTGKINNLNYGENDYQIRYVRSEWQTDADRKKVNKFFGTGVNLNIFEAILSFQSSIRDEHRANRYRSEIEGIDAVMKEVPEQPKNLEKWIIKNCFHETLFYKAEDKSQVYCTHCDSWAKPKEKPVHMLETRCPKCRVEAKYRAWNKQKYLNEYKSVIVLQKLMDGTGYILRKYSATILRRQEGLGTYTWWKDYKLWLDEEAREKLDKNFNSMEYFEYGEFKYTGIVRWCNHVVKGGAFHYYSDSIGRGIVYTPNLKQVLKDREFGKMDLKEMFLGGKRETVEIRKRLRILNENPFLEYLQKSGATVLANEILDSGRLFHFLFNKKAVRIHHVCLLDKQEFRRFCRINGNHDVLEALQAQWDLGKVSDENLTYIQENRIDMAEIKSLCERTGLTQERMLNYIKRQQAQLGMNYEQTENMYEDYLDMAEERGMDLKDEIVCRQKALREYHDRYVEEKNAEKNKKRDLEVNKKFINIAQSYHENKEWFKWSNKEYVIQVPKKASDITQEGRVQHHCVGASDNYMKRMAEGESFILFLRKKEKPEEAYYTLEVKHDGSIRQWYGAYDRKPDKEKIEKVLERFTKKIQRKEKKLQAAAAAEQEAAEQGLIMAAV